MYCNLKVNVKGKVQEIKGVVWKDIDGWYGNIRVLKEHFIKEKKVKVISHEKITSLGYEN